MGSTLMTTRLCLAAVCCLVLLGSVHGIDTFHRLGHLRTAVKEGSCSNTQACGAGQVCCCSKTQNAFPSHLSHLGNKCGKPDQDWTGSCAPPHKTGQGCQYPSRNEEVADKNGPGAPVVVAPKQTTTSVSTSPSVHCPGKHCCKRIGFGALCRSSCSAPYEAAPDDACANWGQKVEEEEASPDADPTPSTSDSNGDAGSPLILLGWDHVQDRDGGNHVSTMKALGIPRSNKRSMVTGYPDLSTVKFNGVVFINAHSSCGGTCLATKAHGKDDYVEAKGADMANELKKMLGTNSQKVTDIVLLSCNIGKYKGGATLRQTLADTFGCPVYSSRWFVNHAIGGHLHMTNDEQATQDIQTPDGHSLSLPTPWNKFVEWIKTGPQGVHGHSGAKKAFTVNVPTGQQGAVDETE